MAIAAPATPNSEYRWHTHRPPTEKLSVVQAGEYTHSHANGDKPHDHGPTEIDRAA